ncbi:putative plastid-lipid-associated protein 7, chloroplastic [Porphyridium purpureum]|uniref:Putative plastid-lipid-associated protein 7, chloroplastic n=1 Tax=Porphyridium purpureum TaxID=35688 RepID=A0A5J4YJ28_PORPP|nr:putative plastid-lipid-associated protein 7, chloroplastic [Porphyridium purpureum]|eukprot:POR3022..scf251_18
MAFATFGPWLPGCAVPAVRACAHWRAEPSWRSQARERGRVKLLCAESGDHDRAKTELLQLLQKPSLKDRGIFGLEDDDEEQIMHAIEQCELAGATLAEKLEPTSDSGFAILNGRWRLLFTTLQILGKRRVKLGLAPTGKPGVVKLGELYQTVDTEKAIARNEVDFDVMGMVEGKLTIDASYTRLSATRVGVETDAAELSPAKLQKLLGEHFDLLLEIFNPQGFLEITYLDDKFRIGRNSADEIFILEKTHPTALRLAPSRSGHIKAHDKYSNPAQLYFIVQLIRYSYLKTKGAFCQVSV